MCGRSGWCVLLYFKKKIVMGANGITTRGVRNNNPLNIRKSLDNWRGKIGDDGEFVKFDTMNNGLRAAFRNLKTYFTKHKINTVGGIVNRWAPPVENDTAAYINFVTLKTGYGINQKLNFDFKTIAPIVKAMSQMESNYIPTDSELRTAWGSM